MKEESQIGDLQTLTPMSWAINLVHDALGE